MKVDGGILVFTYPWGPKQSSTASFGRPGCVEKGMPKGVPPMSAQLTFKMATDKAPLFRHFREQVGFTL